MQSDGDLAPQPWLNARQADQIFSPTEISQPSNPGARGNQRYFLVPPGIVSAVDLEGTDYGLLEVQEKRVRVIKNAPHRAPDTRREILLLTSALRRVKAREFIVLHNCEECEPSDALSEPLPAPPSETAKEKA